MKKTRSCYLDKDLVEIQKTIIFYGENILLELNKLETLIKSSNQNKKVNYFDNSKDQMIQQLLNNIYVYCLFVMYFIFIFLKFIKNKIINKTLP